MEVSTPVTESEEDEEIKKKSIKKRRGMLCSVKVKFNLFIKEQWEPHCSENRYQYQTTRRMKKMKKVCQVQPPKPSHSRYQCTLMFL